jgi:uncharacterized protein (TIGR03790 family)
MVTKREMTADRRVNELELVSHPHPANAMALDLHPASEVAANRRMSWLGAVIQGLISVGGTSRLPLLILFLAFSAGEVAVGNNEGATVAVIYNRKLPESRSLAEYYAARRQVPTNQIFGFDLPTVETMTRLEFREDLQKPLIKRLEEGGLFRFQPSEKGSDGTRTLVEGKIRYLALCYGVPVKIVPDLTLVEEGSEKIRPELRRNEAAVDAELCLLPVAEKKYRLTGPLGNPFFNVTNVAAYHPTNGILLVSRLDGPTVEISRSLVDKAMEAETNGLWGRAYFDARGLTNGSYKPGDDWMRAASEITRRFGLETVFDDKPETFPASFPLSHVAVYAGWYDAQVSGPFARPKVEFMPGAVAYHLHSFSAHVLRTADQQWAGPLLARGATVTMGCVEEPYLEGTPQIAIFLHRLYLGWSVGEAAYAAQSTVSWQTTVVGDPLYRPFRRSLRELHTDLMERRSRLVEWSEVQIANRNLVEGTATRKVIDYLNREPITPKSTVIQEKLGDLFASLGKVSNAIEAYSGALKLDPSPQQRVRLMLGLAAELAAFNREQPAFELYQQFLKEFPDYPGLPSVYQKLAQLADSLGKKSEAEQYLEQANRGVGVQQ